MNTEENRQASREYYLKNRERVLAQKKNIHPNLNVWKGMIQRCTNKNRADYKSYGGAGISICEQWMDFNVFNADMGIRPTMAHTLDRVDGTLGYTKSNCRWATRQEQSENLKSNRNLTANGETRTMSAWARYINMPLPTLFQRLKKSDLQTIINN